MQWKALFFSLAVMVVLTTSAYGGHYAVYPVKDSSVHSHYDLQNTNMGLDGEIASWCDYGWWVIRFYMTFDLAAVTPAEGIDGLTLLLHQSNGAGFSPRLNFHYVADDDWDETTITWNNRPDDGAYQVPPFAVADVDMHHRGWVPITLFNENWNPAFIDNGRITILVKENENGDMGHAFSSKDHEDLSLRPVLIVHTDGTCEGDIDGDRDVDGADMALMAADYNRDDCNGNFCPGDLDGDLTVGIRDLVLYAHSYGRTNCPP